MKTFFWLLVPLFFVVAQEPTLGEFIESRNNLNENGMLVLGSWALGNIALGGIMTARESGSKKYFHQMNAGWNVVNLAIAGFGYYNAINADTVLTLYKSFSEQKTIENILLLNAGLDVGYMMAGLWLAEKSKNNSKNKNRLKGYGQSLVLQGCFLFVFDLSLYYLHNTNNEILRSVLENITFNGQQVGFRLMF